MICNNGPQIISQSVCVPGFTISRLFAVIALVYVSGIVGCTHEPTLNEDLDPISVNLLQEGERALAAGNFDEALLLADSAVVLAPNAIQPIFLRAMIYSRTLQWDEAETAYMEVARHSPSYRGVWNNLGNIAMRKDRLRDAIGYFKKEIEFNPDVHPYLSIGRAYRQLGIIDSAMVAFNEVLKLDSLTVGAYLEQAQIHDEEGDFEKGLIYARHAYRLDPESPNTAYALGSLLAKLGQDKEAIELLHTVTEVWPWHTESHYTMAQALQRQGSVEESQKILEKAEKLWQKQADVSYFQKSVSNDPSDPYNYAALATSFRMAGRYSDAIAAYKIALTLDDNNLEFLNNLASLYFLQQDTLAAIQTYRSIIDQDDTMISAWLNLGVLHALSGRPEEAEIAWREVLALDPAHDQALNFLARLQKDRK